MSTERRITMIAEDYVSFETAKLLKEKGFDEKCQAMYDKDGHFVPFNFKLLTKADKRLFVADAPTLQMAMKWLREIHNLYINIFVTWKDKIPHYQWSIDNLITQDTIYDTPCLEKYEQACEEAIKYCLENLI